MGLWEESLKSQEYTVSYHLLSHKNDDEKDSVINVRDDDPVVVKV